MSTGDLEMNIGEAASRAGVTPKMVRHYEMLGLLPKVHRTEGGYRVYSHAEVHTLQFIKRSRELGFSIPEISQLVKLWQDRRRSSANVKKLASEHVVELERKIQELEEMRNALRHLIHCCHGDHRPECPILNDLERATPKPAPKTLRAARAA